MPKQFTEYETSRILEALAQYKRDAAAHSTPEEDFTFPDYDDVTVICYLIHVAGLADFGE